MKTYNYTLQYIQDTPYLIPFGQGIVDNIPSIMLNDTSVTMWEAINTYDTYEEILSHLTKIFQPDNEKDQLLLAKDIKQFIKRLKMYNIFDNKTFDYLTPYQTKNIFFSIAGISFLYIGHNALFSESFTPFLCSEELTNADITIHTSLLLPRFKPVGNILVRSTDVTIFENEQSYILMMNNYQYVKECHISKASAKCIIYHKELTSADYEEAREEVFHTIRFIFTYAAQQRDMYVVHSASILFQDKAWLFSAPSGTGKSTHTALWNKLYNTPYINGDLNLIAITKQGMLVYGIPWCGTSGISDFNTYPLGGIVLLKQYPKDIIQPLTDAEKILFVMQRFISPCWTKAMEEQNLYAAAEISKNVLITRLLCTKEPSAAQLIHSEIMRYNLSKNK